MTGRMASRSSACDLGERTRLMLRVPVQVEAGEA